MNNETENSHNDSWMKKHRFGTFLGLVLILIYLLVEHKQHVVLYLPYFFLLLCPFMHFFMHGHGGYSRESHTENTNDHCQHGNNEKEINK